MYDNKAVTEPKWKSWIIETSNELFTPEQCRKIIECGRSRPPQEAQVGQTTGGAVDTNKRVTKISWIPFNVLPEMYQALDTFIQKANRNHFGFEDIRITEQAQFT